VPGSLIAFLINVSDCSGSIVSEKAGVAANRPNATARANLFMSAPSRPCRCRRG